MYYQQDDEKLKELRDHISAGASDNIIEMSIACNELTAICERDRLLDFVRFLKNDPFCQFSILVDICGVDYPERSKRFEVVYHFLNPYGNYRLRVKVKIDENITLTSIASLYPCAVWFEREAFDMYGILFSGNDDLRRILTDYDFEGYPLRKDFPLSGFTQIRYDENEKRIIKEPVDLVQGFRDFDFLSPWEGTEYTIPEVVQKETP